MKLSKALNTFYYSTALCDLRLMNKQIVDENITYNSLLYMDIIYTMNAPAPYPSSRKCSMYPSRE